MNLNISFSTVKRVLLSMTLSFFVFGFVLSNVTAVHAVANSVLPDYEYVEWVCDTNDPAFQQETMEAIREAETFKAIFDQTDSDAWKELLACALKTGNIKFWMLPYFVNYTLEFMINIAGVLVVLMIVIGGYYYIYGAVTDDKEKGKTIIMYAIGGYVLVLSSWFIVNAILLAVSA